MKTLISSCVRILTVKGMSFGSPKDLYLENLRMAISHYAGLRIYSLSSDKVLGLSTQYIASGSFTGIPGVFLYTELSEPKNPSK